MIRILTAFTLGVLATNASAAAELVACPYTPAELAASFGKAFRGGEGETKAIPGGSQATCVYAQDRSSVTLTVVQTVLSEAEHRRRTPEFEKGLSGKLTPMAADPDAAKWQLDPYAPNSMSLHYLRGTKRVELRVAGGYLRPAEVQPKMLRLRRLR
jgi:hypothetical protein